MLIVEGPDGSGKSALVERLRTALNFPVAPKVVSSDTTPLTDLTAWTEANVEKGFQYTIFDRHRLISEPIYGPILRSRQSEPFMDLGWMSDMLWRFYRCHPILIYCLPSQQTIQANVTRDDTDNRVVASPEITEKLYTGYVNRAALDFCRGVGRLYNYEVNLPSDLIRWVKFKLEEQDERAKLGTVLAARAASRTGSSTRQAR